MPEIFDCIAATGPGAAGKTTCPICLDEIERDTETLTHIVCRTTFCRECLETWVKQQARGEFATCPIDRLIIGIGEHDGWRGGDEGEDGSDGDDEEEEENDEDPYDDYDEDAAWNFSIAGQPEAEARDTEARDAEARDAEDRVWDAPNHVGLQSPHGLDDRRLQHPSTTPERPGRR